VTADIGASSMLAGSGDQKPIGGNIMAHASTTRLSLKKGKGESRSVKVYDSPSLPGSECRYAISAEGIIDSERTED